MSQAIWPDCVDDGYFVNGCLHPGYVMRDRMEGLAQEMAKAKPPLTSHQIRRFFQHCRTIEARLRAKASTWERELTEFKKLDVAVADAFGKSPPKVPEIFRDFIQRNVAAVKTEKDSMAFGRIQRGDLPALEDLITDSGFYDSAQLHNTISRASNTSMDMGGLFSREETYLAADQDHLTVYVRLNGEFRDLFWRAIRELVTDGFGADRSTGKGQFRIDGELEPADVLDRVEAPNGLLVLSTFQPNVGDPTDGAWDAFTKYGKLGPEFGLESVFKRPLVLLKPGACFRLSEPRPWLGRAIPMNEVLSPDTVTALRSQGFEVIHYAFSLVGSRRVAEWNPRR